MPMRCDFMAGRSPSGFLVAMGLLGMGVLLSACDASGPDVTTVDANTGRWYGNDLRNQGEVVFTANCASCHGGQAQGLAEDWQARQADGSFPPPPLNGSAHAWHHPLSVLLQVINEGGTALGGNMPGFASQLNRQEKLAAIAYFQSFWSNDIYAQWQQMGGTN